MYLHCLYRTKKQDYLFLMSGNIFIFYVTIYYITMGGDLVYFCFEDFF